MKGININGIIKTYSSVPKTWGKNIGLQYASDSELEEIGFYDIVIPNTTGSQQLGDIYFDEGNDVFTYPIESRTFSNTVAELKEDKISELKSLYNSKLAKTDWIIIRDQELGQTTDQTILDNRAQLRTDCLTHETAINAKTTKESVVDYELPNL